MKKIIFALLITLSIVSCKKENETSTKDFGCVYGTLISTGQVKYIACMHRAVYAAGYNQAAADIAADQAGVPRMDVTGMKNYSNVSFRPNSKCDCQ